MAASVLHVLEVPSAALPRPAKSGQARLRMALWLAGAGPDPLDDDHGQAPVALSTGTIADLEVEAPGQCRLLEYRS